jgi:type IV pilus assembly protein PilV
MLMRAKNRAENKQHGVSLLEVMITMVIIAVGLLGLLGLQTKSMSSQKDTFDKKSAAELVAQISERIRANHLGFMDDSYTSAFDIGATVATGPVCGGATPCTPAQIAALDLVHWHTDLRSRIPESGAYIVTSPSASGATPGPAATMATNGTSVRVTVTWMEQNAQTGADPDCTAFGIAAPTAPNAPAQRCLSAEVFP